MRQLPTGTVTFLFTDIESSTRLLDELGQAAYADELSAHRARLREAFAGHGGVEVDTQGDAFFYAFADAGEAIAAAAEAQESLAEGRVRVRIGLHTGEPHLADEGYVGREVHRAARIAAAGHGGQVLLSEATRELVDGEVTDLGEHRLKDFREPVWLFQLGAERFPPLKTISNTNLPRPASLFVGRERELEDVTAVLQGTTRLLTLTGAGGSGKTRLAIEAAGELVPAFKAGVFWVPLAPLRDPALVLETIAQALGAKDGLADHIGERELLLLLDNLEQVVEAAPELALLVESCPNLTLLVTSRERLRVRGEVEYEVPPLAEPEAVALFCARSNLGADDTIAELCRRLDNLPLAVELAASRVSVLSARQILERLAQRLDLLKGGRDAEARQQTLRATIEWSYDLLNEAEQLLFARLSVFAGGCTLEAAEVVAEAEVDVLQSLVDKSLLRHADERFWMLETIRELAAERLAESSEAEELLRRHAEHFLAVAEEAGPRVYRRDRETLDALERDYPNLLLALDFFERVGGIQDGLRLAGALPYFWLLRHHLPEGRRRVDRLLARDEAPTEARARALLTAGMVAINGADPSAGKVRAEQALALCRELDDEWGIARSAYLSGHVAVDEGDVERARSCFERSVQAFRDLGDEHSELMALRVLAWAHAELGEDARAAALWREGLERSRALGDRPLEATFLGQVGELPAPGREGGDIRLLVDALSLHRELDEFEEMEMDLWRIAWALVRAGRARSAAMVLSCSHALREERKLDLRAWAVASVDETRGAIQAALDEAEFAEAWERGRALTLDDVVELALASLSSPA